MRTLVKIVIVVAILAGVGVLFVRSVRSTRAEAYTLERDLLRDWTLTIESAPNPTAPMLTLRGNPELGSALFRQVFARMAESLNAPAVPSIPLVMQAEFEQAIVARLTPEALLAAARKEDLESVVFEPRCLAYRRESAPGVTRQLYFVLLESPEFTRFREAIAVLINPAGAPPALYDPAALSPVLFVGASEPTFNRWLPLRADPQADCIAPIVIS